MLVYRRSNTDTKNGHISSRSHRLQKDGFGYPGVGFRGCKRKHRFFLWGVKISFKKEGGLDTNGQRVHGILTLGRVESMIDNHQVLVSNSAWHTVGNVWSIKLINLHLFRRNQYPGCLCWFQLLLPGIRRIGGELIRLPGCTYSKLHWIAERYSPNKN